MPCERCAGFDALDRFTQVLENGEAAAARRDLSQMHHTLRVLEKALEMVCGLQRNPWDYRRAAEEHIARYDASAAKAAVTRDSKRKVG